MSRAQLPKPADLETTQRATSGPVYQTEQRWNENQALASRPNRPAPNPDTSPEVAARHEHLEPIGVDYPERQLPGISDPTGRVIEKSSDDGVVADHTVECMRPRSAAVPGNAFPGDLRASLSDRICPAVVGLPYSRQIYR
jgi:hypothetical protein